MRRFGGTASFASKKKGSDGPYSQALIARREQEFLASRNKWVFGFKDGELFTACGKISEGILNISLDDRGIACYGPYRPFRKGQYDCTLKFQGKISGTIDVEVAYCNGTKIIAVQNCIDLSADHVIDFAFYLDMDISDLELRIITNGGAAFQMEGLEISEAFLKNLP